MDFTFTPEQEQNPRLMPRICSGFDDAYWLCRDNEAAFPEEFCRAIADAGLNTTEITTRAERAARALPAPEP